MATATQHRPDESAPAARRPALVLGVIATLVIAVLVIAAVGGALRSASPPDSSTPEGVTQVYLQAVFDHDFTAAVALYSEQLASCDVADFRSSWVPESLTATLDDVQMRGDTATVRVRLRSVAGPPPLGGDGYSSVETFTLAREGAQWRITGEPWPVYDCRSTP